MQPAGNNGGLISGICENLIRINQPEPQAFVKDLRKNLFKQVRILKAACIILPKSGKVRNRIAKIKVGESSVCDAYLDTLDRPAHAFDAEKILDKWNFDQHDRVNTRPAVIFAVFILHQVIDEVPVDCSVNRAQDMIFGNHLIQTDKRHMFPVFSRVLVIMDRYHLFLTRNRLRRSER